MKHADGNQTDGDGFPAAFRRLCVETGGGKKGGR